MELDPPHRQEFSRANQHLIQSTFSFIGHDFLNCLVRSISELTGSEIAFVQQVLAQDEVKSRERRHALHRHHDLQDKSSMGWLLTRASYTPTLKTYPQMLAVPLVLHRNSPQACTLLQTTCKVVSAGPGTYLAGEYAGVRLDNSSGKAIGVLWVMKPQCSFALDLLDAVRLRCSRELERVLDEEKLVHEKDAATQDAENKIRFLADMSHEIRTPMNAVIALTDLLLQERTSLNAEQAEHLEVIQTSGHHLLTVINDILDISKISHDPKFKLEHRRFRLRKCVKDALNMARHQASMSQQNKIVYLAEYPPHSDPNIPLSQILSSLNTDLSPSRLLGPRDKVVLPLVCIIDDDVPDHVMGDSMRLTQILLNLCSNAVKFTKSGGICVRIRRYIPTPTLACTEGVPSQKMAYKQKYEAKVENIYARAMRGNNAPSDESSRDHDEFGEVEHGVKALLEISVTDTGIGIPEDRLPRLFKSFSQIDISTARRFGGTGLGLAISSTLVNRMGGGLWVESEAGIGSRFALTLPMTIAPQRMHENVPAAPGILASPPSPSSTLSDSGRSVASASGADIPSMSPRSGYFPPAGYFVQSPSASVSVLQDESTSLDQSVSSYTASQIKGDRHGDKMSQGLQQTQQHVRRPALDRSESTYHWDPRVMNRDDQESLSSCYQIHILLAEDDTVNQKIATSILRRLGYHNVVVANNGSEVLEHMKNHRFDVIFMDLYMPELNGLEATRRIMEERRRQGSVLKNATNVYIIALTASVSKEDRQICTDAGMDDFISKPFTMMEMRSAIKRFADSRKQTDLSKDESIVHRPTCFDNTSATTSATH